MLYNPSLPDMVKIGLTTRSSEDRAGQLYTTGVPTPFQVVSEAFVSDCGSVERFLHDKFRNHRINPKREFFRIPLKTAVAALQEAHSKFYMQHPEAIERIDILRALRDKYSFFMRDNIFCVEFVQYPHGCFLETRTAYGPSPEHEVFDRVDLSFIGNGQGDMFPVNITPMLNADRFVNALDSVCMVNCTDIFDGEYCNRIQKMWDEKRIVLTPQMVADQMI